MKKDPSYNIEVESGVRPQHGTPGISRDEKFYKMDGDLVKVEDEDEDVSDYEDEEDAEDYYDEYHE